MSIGRDLDRRQLLSGAAAGIAGLLLPFSLEPSARAAIVSGTTGATSTTGPAGATGTAGSEINAWLRIGTDESITILIGRSEMGQGVYTALPMLLAEELECDWRRVRVEAAPAAAAYRNLYVVKDMLTGGHADPAPGLAGEMRDWALSLAAGPFSQQVTGGSTSVRGGFEPLRRAGAQARHRLIAAAARNWGVSPAECLARAGLVHHEASGWSLSYGALAAAAADLPSPGSVVLKPPGAWRLLGTAVPRLDLPAKVTGEAIFGIDVRRPGMLFAAIMASPVFGGRVKSVDAAKVQSLPGVVAVVAIPDGVAVVADSTFRASRALAALPVVWDEGANAGLDTAQIFEGFRQALSEEGRIAERRGDAAAALAGAARQLTLDYELPFLAHATMEPMNCTAEVGPDGVDVWAPTQAQDGARAAAATAAGVSADRVRIHTTYLGGGFGRRAESDMVTQAVVIAKALGRPVQAIWSREEDMRHDFYRPGTVQRLRIGLDAAGLPVAWHHRIVCPSILDRIMAAATWLKPDQTSVEGAVGLPYDLRNLTVDYVKRNTPVPVGFWRSVGHSHTAFVTESAIDEVAAAGGRDPLALRRLLLRGNPRVRAVLDLAASEAGWGRPLPPGSGRGIALHVSFGSIVAEVAEVAVAADGTIRVPRVVCAIDCGTVIHPDIVVAQMQSGILFGLTAALAGEITLAKGRIEQGNFDDYPMLHLAESPQIAVHVIESGERPGGVGEPGTPPIAPALANAFYAATGKRIRRLPLMRAGGA